MLKTGDWEARVKNWPVESVFKMGHFEELKIGHWKACVEAAPFSSVKMVHCGKGV